MNLNAFKVDVFFKSHHFDNEDVSHFLFVNENNREKKFWEKNCKLIILDEFSIKIINKIINDILSVVKQF